jgi:hypothetical protein
MMWNEFLRMHWDVLAATDFFTVELWTAMLKNGCEAASQCCFKEKTKTSCFLQNTRFS